jgi:RIO-like serine/threonine protein kinase
MPASGFQNFTIGKISNLIDLKTPGAMCTASTIYRVLIDDLYRKGTVAFDFADWNSLVKNKGTTHGDVERVISSYTEKKGYEVFEKDLDDIIKDLELRSNKRIQVRRAFERYHNAVRLERSLIAIDNQQAVKDAVESNFEAFEEQGVREFMELALEAMPETTKKNLVDLEAIQAAIIYELLSKCHEK